MKTIIIDGITIECKEDGIFYSCYIREQDIYFSTKIKDGTNAIQKKAKAMVKAKEKHLIKFK